jgi:hypothetical protein
VRAVVPVAPFVLCGDSVIRDVVNRIRPYKPAMSGAVRFAIEEVKVGTVGVGMGRYEGFAALVDALLRAVIL